MAFTDGVVEVSRNNQIESNLAHLEQIISRSNPITEDLIAIKNRVSEMARANEIFDDIALIAFEFLK